VKNIDFIITVSCHVPEDSVDESFVFRWWFKSYCRAEIRWLITRHRNTDSASMQTRTQTSVCTEPAADSTNRNLLRMNSGMKQRIAVKAPLTSRENGSGGESRTPATMNAARVLIMILVFMVVS
jgi:hypothetical protein